MTLIVSIRATDGLVLASDSRGTFGDPRGATAQNDSLKKIYVLNRAFSIGIAGAGEIGAGLMGEITATTANANGVSAGMRNVYGVVKSKYKEMFEGFKIQPSTSDAPVRPTLDLTLCGYDRDKSTKADLPRIFTMSSPLDFAPQLHEYGFSVSGVPQLAVYLLNRLYRPDTNLKEAASLAAYTITETIAQDGKVGGPIQMIRVTPQDGCNEFKKEEVDALVRENEDRSTRLRELFFKR